MDKRFCHNCGLEQNEGVEFCPRCGKPVPVPVPAPASTPPTAAQPEIKKTAGPGKVWLPLACGLALVSLVVSVFLFAQNLSANGKISKLTGDIAAIKVAVVTPQPVPSTPATTATPGSKPTFSVGGITTQTDFDLLSIKDPSDNLTYCTIQGTVSCDSASPYFVILKVNGNSGGHFKTQYCCVYVVNGSGYFTLYDIGEYLSASSGSYSAQVLGYTPAEKMDVN